MEKKLLLVTVATHLTHELERFISSAQYHGYDYEILGMGQEWDGGLAENGRLLFPGGGKKVNLLKDFLNDYDGDANVLLFTDSYDVVFNHSPDVILGKWKSMGEKMIFTAEKTCWPDPNLSDIYPDSLSEYRYLNSGGFIGYISDIKNLIKTKCENNDDDQRYYTLKFLNNEGIVLDYGCEIFQTLNVSFNDVLVTRGLLYNHVLNSYPSVIHANGGIGPRTYLNKLYNKMDKRMDVVTQINDNKKVMIQVIFDFGSTDTEVIMDSIENLTYNKKNISLVFFNNSKVNHWSISNFIKKFEDQYEGIEYFYRAELDTYELRDLSLWYAREYNGEYVLFLDGNYNIKNHDTIQLLIAENKDIISPMINTEQTLYSNFWAGVDDNGYFREDEDYFTFRNYEDKGTFVVPFIKGVILFNSRILTNPIFVDLFKQNRYDELYGDDYFVIFCNVLRNSNLFLNVTNKRYYGKFFE